jgi:large subunit ribosomal protein L13
MKIIDATNLSVGRLASYSAKEALNGEEVAVINSEKALILGNKKAILKKYSEKRDIGTRYQGPFYPRIPHRLVKRVIRGMIPYKKSSGRTAFNRIKAYIGVPPELEGKEAITVDVAKVNLAHKRKYLTVGKLCEHLGAKVTW